MICFFNNFTQFLFANQLILGLERIYAGRQNDIGKLLYSNNNAGKLRSMKSCPEGNISVAPFVPLIIYKPVRWFFYRRTGKR